jgi:hypothetical protein
VKLTREVALSRQEAPAFVMVGHLELILLRQVTHLARALFVELLAAADKETGWGRTTYARLMGLLDWDRPAAGPQGEAVTLKRVRHAFAELVAMRMVFVSRKANEHHQGLFFRVPTRVGISPSAGKQGRGQGTSRAQVAQVLDLGVARLSRGSVDNEPPEQGRGTGQGVQEGSSPPSPPHSRRPSRWVRRAQQANAKHRDKPTK